MTTQELLQRFLLETTSYKDVLLNRYELEDSILKIYFQYTYESDIFKEPRTEYSEYQVELMEYMTWIYNSCNKK